MNITQWGSVNPSMPCRPVRANFDRYNFLLVGTPLIGGIHHEMFFSACGHLCGNVSVHSGMCCNCGPPRRPSWDYQCPICLEREST